VETICTTRFNTKNSAFLPGGVSSVRLRWASIVSLCSFHWLSNVCTLSAALYVLELSNVDAFKIISGGYSPACRYRGPGSIPSQLMWALRWISGTGTGFALDTSVSPVSDSAPILRTPFRLHVALTRRKNRRSPGTFQKAMVFRRSENIAWKSNFTFFRLLRASGHRNTQWGRKFPVDPTAWCGGEGGAHGSRMFLWDFCGSLSFDVRQYSDIEHSELFSGKKFVKW
jgi:hypothetical protein